MGMVHLPDRGDFFLAGRIDRNEFQELLKNSTIAH
jgi:hypothetical protein